MYLSFVKISFKIATRAKRWIDSWAYFSTWKLLFLYQNPRRTFWINFSKLNLPKNPLKIWKWIENMVGRVERMNIPRDALEYWRGVQTSPNQIHINFLRSYHCITNKKPSHWHLFFLISSTSPGFCPSALSSVSPMAIICM